MKQLFGDGIHDDTEAIQERIDSGVCEVALPTPDKFYLISKPLELPSNFRLVLPRFAEIRLADGSNCVMLKNKTKEIADFRHEKSIWSCTKQYSADFICENIEICGGIWNCNNIGQNGNPGETGLFEPEGYSGFGMLFFGVRGFSMRSLTVKDPVTFGMTLDWVSWFTIEDITFDYNYGNPNPVNMDGIHIDGNCHWGVIRNLKGSCYDDVVALNADEGSGGDITNIEVSGIWAENAHSAVRMLAVYSKLENIHVHDIYGTYYQYCIGITKYYEGACIGGYSGILIDHVYASKAERLPVYCKEGMYVFPLIWIEGNLAIKDLSISHVHRKESVTPVETIHFGENTCADSVSLSHIFTENATSESMPLFVNYGKIRRLRTEVLNCGDDPVIVDKGIIEKQTGVL